MDPFMMETVSDIDFYVRKIHRLEQDLQGCEDELSNAKVRLRRAEDYEYKCELAAKHNNKLTLDNDSLQAEIRGLRVLVDDLRMDLERAASRSPRKQRQQKGQQGESRRKEGQPKDSLVQGLDDNDINRRHQEEIESWKDRFQKLQRENEEKMSHLKESFQSENLKAHQKRSREEEHKVENLRQELGKYRKLYEQKANMDDFVREKIQRIKVEKDKQISRLNNILESQYKDFETQGQQHTQEVLSVKDKYTQMLSVQLQKIHRAMDNQDLIFDAQIDGLRKLIELKDSDIENMLKQLKNNTLRHEDEREKLRGENQKLAEVLYQVQRENESELYNMKERLTKINVDEVQKLTGQYESIKSTLEEEINQLKDYIQKKEEEYRHQVKEMERITSALEDKVNERDDQINHLIQKLSHTGIQSMSDVREISHTMHKIKEEKEEVFAGLSDNITFKNLQIKKLTESIELKNIEIKNLYNDVAYLKKQTGEVQKELEGKWRQERKEREGERQGLRQQNETQESDWKAKEREWKMREKSFLNDKEKSDRENLKLRLSRDELEKVNVELSNQVKEVDVLYKKEVKKNHIFTLDTGSLRRELIHQIEKQQIDLEIAKKQETQDLKKKHEIQLDRLRFEVSNLQTVVNTKNIELDKLNTQLKKFDSSSEKVLKGVFQQYQQKLAALNSEIYLTQNLYNTFMESKSRARREPS